MYSRPELTESAPGMPRPLLSAPKPRLAEVLTARELAAVRYFVARVLDEVPAVLAEAALFGSKARGQARADSDVDVLLVFQNLPEDREPHASHAELIAEEVAGETGVPVTTWSVSLIDLEIGRRTPMLVDALDDSVPIWYWPDRIPPVAFTPPDAVRCARALLERVAEGSTEFAEYLHRGDRPGARSRARDDVVRLCTALLLVRGLTRPRRSEVIEAYRQLDPRGGSLPPFLGRTLEWVRRSFGVDGRTDDLLPDPPPDGDAAVAASIDILRERVVEHVEGLARKIDLV